MPKKPKIDHEYHAGKDKLTIKIQGYSLKSKNSRGQIIKKVIAAVERLPDKLITSARKDQKKGRSKKLPRSKRDAVFMQSGD